MPLILGRHTYYCEPQHIRGSMNDIYIGNFSSLAENIVWDGGFQHARAVTTFMMHKIFPECPNNTVCNGDIYVGSDVWIGENAMIMSGISIGDGAIIGARSVVRRDILPYEVYTGTETKQRFRFKMSYCEALMDIKWWYWDDERIFANWPLLMSGDVEKFIKEHI